MKLKTCFILQITTNTKQPLKALRKPSQKFWPKILTPDLFYSNLYLTFLRSCCEKIFSKLYV